MRKTETAEFQGFVKAKLEDISQDVKDMKANYREQISACDSRFKSIESQAGESRTSIAKITVIIGGISVVASVIASWIITNILNSLH